MKINVYIDGFNLYYGAVKGTPYRWLNLLRMSELLFPKDAINKIKYFTARVSARPSDPDQPIRQQTYFRALRTVPQIEIIEGTFLVKEITMPLAGTTPQRYARVIKTEEKGSDVNLAVHLLNDGYKKDYELAVMITNDSDLIEPMRLVKTELGLPVGLVNPQRHPSFLLARHATFIKQLRAGVLGASQFPPTLTDADGTFHKPARW
jgi:uncharacterized LabA/DUF88 family protein